MKLRRFLRWVSAGCLVGLAGIGLVEAVRFIRDNLPVPVVAGVERAYAGRYADDPAYKVLLATAPALRSQALAEVQWRLGLPQREEKRIVIRFADTGVLPGTGARTRTRYLNGRKSQVVTFLVEPILSGQAPFERTLLHELCHAVMRQQMGGHYAKVPPWVREGVAVWVAGQLEEKTDQAIAAKLAAGQDPLTLINGLESKAHGLDDYPEDALFFRYLEETYGTERVVEVIQRLFEGARVRDALERVTGLSWEVLQVRARAFSLQYLSARQ